MACVWWCWWCVWHYKISFFFTEFPSTFPSIVFSHVFIHRSHASFLRNGPLLKQMEQKSKSFTENKFIQCNKHFASFLSSQDLQFAFAWQTMARFILRIAFDSNFKSTNNNIRSFNHGKSVRKRVYIVSNRNVRFLYSICSKLYICQWK